MLLLREQAARRYNENLGRMEFINHQIEENRKGHIPLTNITDDEDRLRQRMSREGGSTRTQLERINGVPDFQDIHIVEKLVRHASSVCRIIIKSSYGVSGYGTGFLIAPNILITNNHVLPDAEAAALATAQFDYQLDASHNIRPVFSFPLRPDKLFVTSEYVKNQHNPFSGLDFTLVWVDSKSINSNKDLGEFSYIKLDGGLGKILEGENCVVIQHPGGDLKKIVLKDIRMISLMDDFLVYESDTLPGASGSPVIGLGTGHVVALHHSAVPRTDDKGNWLRKDDSPVQANDDDKVIDWIGNEGVRISRILNALSSMNIPKAMKNIIDENIIAGKNTPQGFKSSSAMPDESKKETRTNEGNIQHFEIVISEQQGFNGNIELAIREVVNDVIALKSVFPLSTDKKIKRILYLTIRSSGNPWETAEKLEQLPQIQDCIPDLPAKTDVGVSENVNLTGFNATESEFIVNDGRAELNEKKFTTKWQNSKWYKKATQPNALPNYCRWWNWEAINLLPQAKRGAATWNGIQKNLAELTLVQLDTGYSDHSKCANGYNFQKDFDFVDADVDAKDAFSKVFGKHPWHGTRTASLAIGGLLKTDPTKMDGNGGVLSFNNIPAVKLIPHRIAQSVILLGRGKELVNAARYAIRNQADVMFMCMGSYPRPMIEAVAKEAYEKGVIWVCAAGNEVEVVVAPALYPGTIAVAAINPDDKPWDGSSHGTTVDIAAPGEDVYVPFLDKDGNEIMAYGSGTSYATPHVASAAMLWKAKNLEEIEQKYLQPWQIVEAFRKSLIKTSRPFADSTWKGDYGHGILDIEKLLNYPLPKVDDITHAYKDKPILKKWDNGVRQAVHFLWNGLRKKTGKLVGIESTLVDTELTERGQQALKAFEFYPAVAAGRQESANANLNGKASKIIHHYFEN